MSALLDVRREGDRVILLLDGDGVGATLAFALGAWVRSRPVGTCELYIRARLRRTGRPADMRVTRERFEPLEAAAMVAELRGIVTEHEGA